MTLGAVDILLVDDDGDVRDAITDRLEREGYRVESCSNGLDALEWLRGAARLPRLILLDMMMPVMDGWHFREEQLQDTVLAGVPLVILSAGLDPVPGRAVERLQKPIKARDLIAVVARYCGPPSGDGRPSDADSGARTAPGAR